MSDRKEYWDEDLQDWVVEYDHFVFGRICQIYPAAPAARLDSFTHWSLSESINSRLLIACNCNKDGGSDGED